MINELPLLCIVCWLTVAAAHDPQARFEIVTRDDPLSVRTAIDPKGRLKDRLTIGPRKTQEMPNAVRGHYP